VCSGEVIKPSTTGALSREAVITRANVPYQTSMNSGPVAGPKGKFCVGMNSHIIDFGETRHIMHDKRPLMILVIRDTPCALEMLFKVKPLREHLVEPRMELTTRNTANIDACVACHHQL